MWRQYRRAMGPGLVTGASDDDPSGIATYAQVGARFGLALLWTTLLTLPLMVGVQEICDRMALATGSSLGALAMRRFERMGQVILGALLVVLIVASALNIAADLVAIGSGMRLLHAGPTALWALGAGAVITLLLIFGSFARIALAFKALCAALLSYLAVAVLVTHHWGTAAALAASLNVDAPSGETGWEGPTPRSRCSSRLEWRPRSLVSVRYRTELDHDVRHRRSGADRDSSHAGQPSPSSEPTSPLLPARDIRKACGEAHRVLPGLETIQFEAVLRKCRLFSFHDVCRR